MPYKEKSLLGEPAFKMLYYVQLPSFWPEVYLLQHLDFDGGQQGIPREESKNRAAYFDIPP